MTLWDIGILLSAVAIALSFVGILIELIKENKQ